MLSRLAKAIGWDRNPLRRRIDRVETAILAGLLALFLIGAPGVAVMVDRVTLASAIQQQHKERTWRLVPAVLERRAAAPQFAPYGAPQDVVVRARWTAPDGNKRAGWVMARQGSPRGNSVRVWVSRSGALTGPPIT